MKKNLLIITIVGLMSACSSADAEKETSKLQAETEAIENSSEKITEVLESSEKELEENEHTIDSLLNNL